jgi:protease IV
MEAVKSTPLKAAPDGYEPTSPEATAALNSIIQDSYAWFKGAVQDRRHLSDSELQTAADGRVFTGHQGIDLKLVDELGDEKAAIAWLVKEKNINASLPVRDYHLQTRLGDLPFLHAAVGAALDGVGLTGLARLLDQLAPVDGVASYNLDGLLALWHPAGTN